MSSYIGGNPGWGVFWLGGDLGIRVCKQTDVRKWPNLVTRQQPLFQPLMLKSFGRPLVSFSVFEALIKLHLCPHPAHLMSSIDICVLLH